MTQPLYYVRSALKVNTGALADEAKCSSTLVSLVENGHREPSPEVKRNIVRAMRKFINKTTLFNKER